MVRLTTFLLAAFLFLAFLAPSAILAIGSLVLAAATEVPAVVARIRASRNDEKRFGTTR